MKKILTVNRSAHRGFSLVEILVAVAIGLIGTVIMFQLFAVSEGQKRTTVSGGDAQQNGAIALYTMERNLRNAGHGYAALIRLGQPAYGWDAGAGVARPTRYFRPLIITPGADTDSIEVNYSNYTGVSVGIPIGNDWNPGAAAVPNTIFLSTTAGFSQGDILVVCSFPTAITPNNTCIHTQVTDVRAGQVDVNAFPDPITRAGRIGPTEFNPVGGFSASLAPVVALDGKVMPPNYISGTAEDFLATAYNIGWNPVSRRYSVQAGRLLETDAGGPAQEFADGIVSLRAQYGLDLDANGSVEAWVNPRGNTGDPLSSHTPNHLLFDITSPATIAASWSIVVAVRVGLVTRSGVMEKTEVESRSKIPFWINDGAASASGPEFTVPAGDGKRYRYQVVETVVPFRDAIWTPHR